MVTVVELLVHVMHVVRGRSALRSYLGRGGTTNNCSFILLCSGGCATAEANILISLKVGFWLPAQSRTQRAVAAVTLFAAWLFQAAAHVPTRYQNNGAAC
jgi:hypothetical protein